MAKPDDRDQVTTPLITLDDVRANPEVAVFVRKADQNLEMLGYTEHAERHAGIVATHGAQHPARSGLPGAQRRARRHRRLPARRRQRHHPGSITASPRR